MADRDPIHARIEALGQEGTFLGGDDDDAGPDIDFPDADDDGPVEAEVSRPRRMRHQIIEGEQQDQPRAKPGPKSKKGPPRNATLAMVIAAMRAKGKEITIGPRHKVGTGQDDAESDYVAASLSGNAKPPPSNLGDDDDPPAAHDEAIAEDNPVAETAQPEDGDTTAPPEEAAIEDTAEEAEVVIEAVEENGIVEEAAPTLELEKPGFVSECLDLPTEMVVAIPAAIGDAVIIEEVQAADSGEPITEKVENDASSGAEDAETLTESTAETTETIELPDTLKPYELIFMGLLIARMGEIVPVAELLAPVNEARLAHGATALTKLSNVFSMMCAKLPTELSERLWEEDGGFILDPAPKP